MTLLRTASGHAGVSADRDLELFRALGWTPSHWYKRRVDCDMCQAKWPLLARVKPLPRTAATA